MNDQLPPAGFTGKKEESIGKFIMCLFNSRTQAHIFHLQTSSFAAHKALDDYYNSIVDLVDSIAETYQGKYGIIKGYKQEYDIKEDTDYIRYFEELAKEVEDSRYVVFKKEDTNLQNEIDNVVSLIYSTIYKLKFLK